MNVSHQGRNETQLIFCNDKVDPDLVTRLLGLSPSEALRLGEPLKYENGFERASHVGVWKLDLPGGTHDGTIEEQLARWVEVLRPRAAALASLRQLGYAPYLDCKADKGSLSLCIEPDLLLSLAEIKISLSIWLYEKH